MRLKTFLGVALFLAAPVGTGLLAQGTGEETVEVPLRVLDGRLVVTVQGSEGEEMDFLLSTGNGVTVFSATGEARVGEGSGALNLAGIPLVTQGSQTIPDERLMVGGKVLEGIVGSNTLNQYDILIDAPGGRLLLRPAGGGVEWPGVSLGEPVHLRVFHGLILSLDGELGGRGYGAMLDVGTDGVVVSGSVKEALGLENVDHATLTLGATTFNDLPVRVEELDIFQRFDPAGRGFLIVGASIGLDCPLSVSWVRSELRMCSR